jgi:hypothetical protein
MTPACVTYFTVFGALHLQREGELTTLQAFGTTAAIKHAGPIVSPGKQNTLSALARSIA